MQEVRLNTTISRPVSFAPSYQNYAIPDTGINLGQQVSHSVFGTGTVLNFEGNGPSARVQVNFENEGTKWLVVQYANLQAV